MDLAVFYKGRGATRNPAGRFEAFSAIPEDDGWSSLGEILGAPPPSTEIFADTSRTAIVRNTSPDLPFDRSINAYRGCEHGCVYCFARPTHNYLGLSAGLDFETKIWAKHDVAQLLREELSKAGYTCRPIALGTNTDPYQPIERRLSLTRSILEVLREARHPVGIVTKSSLVLRDLDILSDMARDGLARVAISITTQDRVLARKLEPRATTPARRFETVRMLAEAGIETGVMTAPVIPGLTDHEIEAFSRRRFRATNAGFILLRLPHDVRELFESWLEEHYPLRRAHVLSLIRQTRGGQLNDPRFGTRMTGKGAYADLLRRRFERACARLGLDRQRVPTRCDLFSAPDRDGQLELFG
ncbi:MAG: PA0069 family radical SAM protein [Geminicoccaceae bacterium]